MIERVIFHNPENGFCVVRVRVAGRRRLQTVVGHSALVAPGGRIEASGRFREHREFGLRFEAERVRTTAPEAETGAEKFLSSGLIHGIGPGLAKRMVATFGAQVFEVIEKAPELLGDVPGIGPARSRRIQAAWLEATCVRGIMDFLQSHGLNALKAVRVYRLLGRDAVNLIENDPFILSREIPGIGFASADLVARHLSMEPDAPHRLRAGLHSVMQEELASGQSAVPRLRLIARAARLLSLPKDRVAVALEDELAAGGGLVIAREADVGAEGGASRDDREELVYLPSILEAERDVAQRFVRLGEGPPPWGRVDLERAGEWLAATLSPRLGASQIEALQLALRSKTAVITGGPGTGKTTILRGLLRYFHALGVSFACVAPTGRSSRRMSDATGFEAKTIHRLLGFDALNGGFLYRDERRLPVELVVVDEASMVDLELMAALLHAIPEDAALFLIGDVDQLPSVRAGQVLQAICKSGVAPVARLRETFRQDAGSGIIRIASRVKEGDWPALALDLSSGSASSDSVASNDAYFIRSGSVDAAAATIVSLVADRIPARFGFDPRRHIQVLTPMNRGPLGARRLNESLQAALNPSVEGRVERFGTRFALGDRVLMTMNDYQRDLFNGDVGRVTAIDLEAERVSLDFDGFEHHFEFSDLDLLSLAYAITVHKAQGSEYEAVVIPVWPEHEILLKRSLLYTALTRARKLVVLVGDPQTFRRAVSSFDRGRRACGLERRLRALRDSRTSQSGACR